MKRWIGLICLVIGIIFLILEFGILHLVGTLAAVLTILGILLMIVGIGLLVKVKDKELIFFIFDLILSAVTALS